MIKRMALKVLGVFLFFCGAGMIEMAIRQPDFELGARIFSGVCGLILLVGGIVFVIMRMDDALDIRYDPGRDESYWNGPRYTGSKKGKGAKLLRELRSDVSPRFLIASVDHDDTERLIRSFRTAYAAFFDRAGRTENDPIQDVATQIYWHSLYLQKRRMDRKRIQSHLESERLHYGNVNPVRSDEVFDGKYQIADVSETVEARLLYTSELGKPLYKETCLQTAWYRILHAAQTDEEELIICPNCGSASTRENLIDGCDYCGTKFTVEDLGARVSEFGFRPDYEAEYARYTGVRETYAKRVALIVGLPTLLLFLIAALSAITWDASTFYTLQVAAVMFAAAFPTFAVVFFAELIFFIFFFPVLQARASITFLRKRRLKSMERQRVIDTTAEQQVRDFDPLFSLNGFYSNVQNKLSVIHFAENVQDAAAFAENSQAENQIASYIPQYRDVIRIDTEGLSLDSYQVRGDCQEATVTANLQLLSEKNGVAKKNHETVRLHLVKSSACKTQAVCAPAFMRCKSCGASMSMMDGRVCDYCGQSRDLSSYDWAIQGYEAL